MNTERKGKTTTIVEIETDEMAALLRSVCGAPDHASVSIDAYDGAKIEWSIEEPVV